MGDSDGRRDGVFTEEPDLGVSSTSKRIEGYKMQVGVQEKRSSV